MKEIHDRLFVSDLSDCSFNRDYDLEWAIVHACKSPCHQRAVGYQGNLGSSHPNYLILEKDNDLYMNLIDPDRPLFMDESFVSFLAFIDHHWDNGRKILIHCNQGLSRAPSLALILLAKKHGAISNDSFTVARKEFLDTYPNYSPGLGIQKFLTKNWNSATIFG